MHTCLKTAWMTCGCLWMSVVQAQRKVVSEWSCTDAFQWQTLQLVLETPHPHTQQTAFYFLYFKKTAQMFPSFEYKLREVTDVMSWIKCSAQSFFSRIKEAVVIPRIYRELWFIHIKGLYKEANLFFLLLLRQENGNRMKTDLLKFIQKTMTTFKTELLPLFLCWSSICYNTGNQRELKLCSAWSLDKERLKATAACECYSGPDSSLPSGGKAGSLWTWLEKI